MIAILVLAGLIVIVAIRWATAIERTLPGTPVIGRDVTVPRAICIPTAYRRGRFDPLNTGRETTRPTTSQENAS